MQAQLDRPGVLHIVEEPSDPPFDHRLITDRIESSYENALAGSGDRFVPADDFRANRWAS